MKTFFKFIITVIISTFVSAVIARFSPKFDLYIIYNTVLIIALLVARRLLVKESWEQYIGYFLYIYIIVGVCVALVNGCVYKSPHSTSYILNKNGVRFNIPAGYIWAKDWGKGRELSGASMYALYPGIEPKNKNNKHIFKQIGRGEGRKVLFYIKDSSKDASKTVEGSIARTLKHKRVKNTGQVYKGLDVYTAYSKTNEFLLGSWRSGEPVFFSCNKDGTVKYPSCNTNIMYSDNLMLHIVFSKTLLIEWETLLTDLREKVKGFQIEKSLTVRVGNKE